MQLTYVRVGQDPKCPGTRQLKTQSSKIKHELQFGRFVENVDRQVRFSSKVSTRLCNGVDF